MLKSKAKLFLFFMCLMLHRNLKDDDRKCCKFFSCIMIKFHATLFYWTRHWSINCRAFYLSTLRMYGEGVYGCFVFKLYSIIMSFNNVKCIIIIVLGRRGTYMCYDNIYDSIVRSCDVDSFPIILRLHFVWWLGTFKASNKAEFENIVIFRSG